MTLAFPSALLVGCASRTWWRERGEEKVRGKLNISRWHLFYFLPWPSGVCSNWWPHHQCQPTSPLWRRTQHAHARRMLWYFFSHACVFWRSVCTNVYKKGPVKMSFLCLFQDSSQWHNIGPKDAVINLNVPRRFPAPLSSVKEKLDFQKGLTSVLYSSVQASRVKTNQLTSLTWSSLFVTPAQRDVSAVNAKVRRRENTPIKQPVFPDRFVKAEWC